MNGVGQKGEEGKWNIKEVKKKCSERSTERLKMMDPLSYVAYTDEDSKEQILKYAHS